VSNECGGKELEPFPFDDEEDHNNTGSGSAGSLGGIDDNETLSQRINGLDLDNGLEVFLKIKLNTASSQHTMLI
jgi:hypothetical protein